MRIEAYDKMCEEAIERINILPPEKMTHEIVDIKEALNVVLNEPNDEKLTDYYKRIEEFYSVNVNKGLEYMNGSYLIHGV